MSQITLNDQLETLLSEDIASVIERELTTFDKLVAPFSDVLVLFGAGNLGKKTLAGLRQVGIEPLAFADNNPALWGKKVDDLLVMSPADAAQKFNHKAAFIITIAQGGSCWSIYDRQKQLEALDCSRILSFGPLFWKYPDIFLPHHMVDLPHKIIQQADIINKGFSLWVDDASRREYITQLRWQILMDIDDLPPPVVHDMYFPTDLLKIRADETFIDCGAYDGDTIRVFLKNHANSFERIVAFEPDFKNAEKLRRYVLTLPGRLQDQIVIHPLSVGERRERVSFNSMGTMVSSVGSGKEFVDSVALDDALANLKPTYIKMNIEGSELEALAGASRLIKENLPVLAICVYHRYDHLWRIPWVIHLIQNNYLFFLRPYFDKLWEILCYALPKNRVIHVATPE